MELTCYRKYNRGPLKGHYDTTLRAFCGGQENDFTDSYQWWIISGPEI